MSTRREAALFLRFVLNGLLATAVHFLVLTLLIEVADLRWAWAANGIAAVFGILTSYVGNRLFVFRARGSKATQFAAFLVLYASVAAFHAAGLGLWSDVLNLPYPPGFLLLAGISMVLTFLGNRFVVFRDTDRA